MLLSFGQGSLWRAVPRRPGQQLLPDAAAAADLSAGVTPRSGAVTFPHRLPLRSIPCSASASNKPHPAAKSTPVWLAIWRIWAGFANSQLRYSAFATPNNICAHPSLLPHWAAAQTKQIFRPICTDCLRHLRISAG